ncbi:hypothetical protein CLAFUW4_06470 [Fulvia fulva]|uniref:Uncharacterized protein n=1 Tax=Passalora fulva TaxID=5499 RepID=A0A9Q8P8U7_PASFU|nr:uncharacterized protein CLAFUR5_06614 [Fulvia fulva]KAK4624724.1 hypothetical protein CLAFUR4_06474 [Fulvia fulva]KAK4625355.1 hypothetical protein CLAFUR0_06475 [Fulvia fulva]UJO17579.1 hypothetical protein CLAFUR5_06614 [Fulvia fulva]WPV15378.1 hypothetical protein CLAFUW4_06470 [Fulvia fulva]WPV29429.1 hypothetical protein CLAFUW7_06470 [Fulvia fulva]
MSTTYVELAVLCYEGGADCSTTRIRQSQKPYWPSTATILDRPESWAMRESGTNPLIAQMIFQHFLDAVRPRRTAQYSVFETFFLEPDRPYVDGGTDADTPVGHLGNELISQRFTQLINTFIVATTAPVALTGGFGVSTPFMDYNTSRTDLQIETTSVIIRCHKMWAICLICLSSLLVIAGLLTAFLDLRRKAPGIFDSFVTSIRDSPYARLQHLSSTEDSVDLARRQQNTRVRIGDVKSDDTHGYNAVATLSGSHEVGRLGSRRLYI